MHRLDYDLKGWVIRRCSILLLSVIPCGCIEVSGGAVEARWSLRDARGNGVNCQTPNSPEVDVQIEKITFSLHPVEGGEDPCTIENLCQFTCERNVGTTGFVIPAGDYSMILQATSPEGKLLDPDVEVIAPPAVVRTVRTGEITDLSVNLIIVKRALSSQ